MVYSKDAECGEFGLIDEGKIFVEVLPADIECHCTSGVSSSGEISLNNGVRNLICQKTIDLTDSYKDTIEMTISYKYQNEILTTMSVIGE